MKKYIFLISALLISLSAAAYENIDSLSKYTISNADSLIIIQNATGVDVKVVNGGANSSQSINFKQPIDGTIVVETRTRRAAQQLGIKDVLKVTLNDDTTETQGIWNVICGGLFFGFNTAISAPPGLDIEMGKSFEFGIVNALALQYCTADNKNALSFGLGLDWRNYQITTPTRFIPTPTGIGFGPYETTDIRQKGSRLMVFSLTLPLIYKRFIKFNNGKYATGFHIGASLNFNTHSSIHTSWENLQGTVTKTVVNNKHQRPVTFDILGGIRLGYGLSLYAKYSPMNVLKAQSVQFKSFTTGLIFAF